MFSYVIGKYRPWRDMPERDCNMILEDATQAMFLEIKKCPLPGSYEQGDDVKYYRHWVTVCCMYRSRYYGISYVSKKGAYWNSISESHG